MLVHQQLTLLALGRAVPDRKPFYRKVSTHPAGASADDAARLEAGIESYTMPTDNRPLRSRDEALPLEASQRGLGTQSIHGC